MSSLSFGGQSCADMALTGCHRCVRLKLQGHNDSDAIPGRCTSQGRRPYRTIYSSYYGWVFGLSSRLGKDEAPTFILFRKSQRWE